MKRKGLLDEAESYYRRAFRALSGLPEMDAAREAAHGNLLWVQRNRLESYEPQYLKGGDLRLINKIKTDGGAILGLSYSAERQMLISGGQDSLLKLWGSDSLYLIHTFQGHENAISSVAFGSGENVGVSGSWDRTVRQWNLVGLEALPFIQRCPSDVCGVAASIEGTPQIVFALEDGLVGVWNDPFSEGAKVLGRHQDTATSTAISHDGRMAISGSFDKSIRVWELKTGHFISLRGHRARVSTTGISHDGHFGFSGGQDGQIIVWDLNTYEMIHMLCGHEEYVAAIVVTWDSRWIASVSWDKTVRIWDADTGACAAIFEVGEQVWAIAASPDFDAIFVGDKAGLIHKLQFVAYQGDLVDQKDAISLKGCLTVCPRLRGRDAEWAACIVGN